MKIAFIGKGGSGKSTVSWLATQLLAAEGRQVLAIDADHNMDLAALLHVPIDADTQTFHRNHDRFKEVVGQGANETWGALVLGGRELPRFSVHPADSFTQSISQPVPGTDRIQLAVVGLGADDVLFSSKCAHGHSAPLKFYLPLLETADASAVVVDGVAGADMMNFGLFLGCDAVVAVVEPHPNSMRVLTQVAAIADKTGLPLFVAINKVQGESPLLTEIEETWSDRIVGRIPADLALAAYDFEALAPETHDAGEAMLSALMKCTGGSGDALVRIRVFEETRAKAFQ